MTKHRLVSILLVAFILRASTLFWGFPLTDKFASYYHPDEPKIIEGASDFPAHILKNRDFRYPTFLHYFVGIAALPLKLLPVDPELRFNLVYLAGRIISILLALGTILLTYRIGKRWYGENAGLIASTLVALTMYHADHSNWATTDIASGFFFTLLIDRIPVNSGASMPRPVFWSAAIGLGLLVGTKYTGAIAVLPLATYAASNVHAQLEALSEASLGNRLKPFTSWFGFGACAAIVFLITTPGSLLYPRAFYQSLVYESERLALTSLPLTHPAVWQSLFTSMEIAMGLPLCLTALFGMALSIQKRYRTAISLALGLTIVILLVYFGYSIHPRYLILILPALAIFASLGLRELISRHRRLGIGWMVILMAYSAIYTILALAARAGDPRTMAAHYIVERFPRGTSIGIASSSEEYDWYIHAWRYPKIDFEQYREVDIFDSPEVILLSSADFDLIDEALRSGALGENYSVPEDMISEWYRSSPPSPRLFQFYEEILSGDGSYCLDRVFMTATTIPIEFPAPEIRIYIDRSMGNCGLDP